MSNDPVQGEGNYKAARDYDDATERFVKAGKVESAARSAAPHDAREAREMADAEEEGKRHSKGEDPLLKKPAAAHRDADVQADADVGGDTDAEAEAPE